MTKIKHLLTAILIFSFSLLQSQTNCPDDIPGYSFLGEYNNHHYFLHNDANTWEVAAIVVAANGGYLASINDAAENNWLYQTLGNSMVFIGYNDAASEGNFAWDSGEATSYQNLQGSNDAGDDYATMNFWNGGWSLDNQYVQRQYVMEVECETQSTLNLGFCPEDIVLEPIVGNPVRQLEWFPPNAIDDCPGQVSVTQISGPSLGNNVSVGTYEIVYELSNDCGESVLCSFSFTIPETMDECLTEVTQGNLECTEYLPNGNLRILKRVGYPNPGVSEYIYNTNGTLESSEFIGVNGISNWFITDGNALFSDGIGNILSVYPIPQSVSDIGYESVVLGENLTYTFAGINGAQGQVSYGITRIDYSGNVLATMELFTKPAGQFIKNNILQIKRINDERIGMLYIHGASINMLIMDNDLNVIDDQFLMSVSIPGLSYLNNFYSFLFKSECGLWKLSTDYTTTYYSGGPSVFSNGNRIKYFTFENDEFVTNSSYSYTEYESQDYAVNSNFKTLNQNFSGPAADGGILTASRSYQGNFFNPNTAAEILETDTLFLQHELNGTIIWSDFLVPASNYVFNKLVQIGDSYYLLANSNGGIQLLEIGCDGNTNEGGDCPDEISGYEFLGELNGHQYFLSNSVSSWSNAAVEAATAGGYLASINDVGENDFLYQTLGNTMAFIGYTDGENEGNFVWDSQETSSFENLEESNSAQGDFATMNFWNGGWSLDNEYVQRPHILEVECNDEGNNGGDCGSSISGFTLLGAYEDHAYYISDDMATWPSAHSEAAQNAGYLASLNDEDEHDFLTELISEMVFIGLNDINAEGQAMWDDGSSFNLSANATGNTASKDFGTMNFWNGGFNFDGQYVQRKFVMEVPCNNSNNQEVVLSPEEDAEEFGKLNLIVDKIYPNPARERITLDYESLFATETNLQIYNLTGQLVKAETLKVEEGKNQITLDVSNLFAGMYFILIPQESGKVTTHHFALIRM